MLREGAPERESTHAVLHEDPDIVAGSVTIEALVDDRPVVLSLVRPGETVALFDGLRIGRNDDNDVVIADGKVSRHHARIVADGGGFAIEDLQSSNGTLSTARRCSARGCIAGASIVIGETVLEIRG